MLGKGYLLMRLLCLGTMIAIPAVGVVLAIVSGARFHHFAARTPWIGRPDDLAELQGLLRRQQRLDLVQLLLLGLPWLAFITGCHRHVLTGVDLPFILAPTLILLVACAYSKSGEVRAKRLPLNDNLSADFDPEVDTGVRPAIPPW